MTPLVDWIYATARPTTVWVLFAIALVFAVVLFPAKRAHYPCCYTTAAGKEKPFTTFDGSWFYTPREAQAKLAALGENGRRVYRSQEIQLDLVFPLVYGLMLAWGLALLAPGTRLPRWIVLVPLIGAIADYVENTCAILMIDRFGKGSIDTLATIGGVFTPIKQVLVTGTFLVWAALAVAAWLRK